MSRLSARSSRSVDAGDEKRKSKGAKILSTDLKQKIRSIPEDPPGVKSLSPYWFSYGRSFGASDSSNHLTYNKIITVEASALPPLYPLTIFATPCGPLRLGSTASNDYHLVE